jgi:hypothetical protein
MLYEPEFKRAREALTKDESGIVRLWESEREILTLAWRNSVPREKFSFDEHGFELHNGWFNRPYMLTIGATLLDGEELLAEMEIASCQGQTRSIPFVDAGNGRTAIVQIRGGEFLFPLLRSHPDFCDVTIALSDGSRAFANARCLCTLSPVLRARLRGPLASGSDIVLDDEAGPLFVRFLDLGCVQSSISDASLVALTLFADKYQITTLTNACAFLIEWRLREALDKKRDEFTAVENFIPLTKLDSCPGKYLMQQLTERVVSLAAKDDMAPFLALARSTRKRRRGATPPPEDTGAPPLDEKTPFPLTK